MVFDAILTSTELLWNREAQPVGYAGVEMIVVIAPNLHVFGRDYVCQEDAGAQLPAGVSFTQTDLSHLRLKFDSLGHLDVAGSWERNNAPNGSAGVRFKVAVLGDAQISSSSSSSEDANFDCKFCEAIQWTLEFDACGHLTKVFGEDMAELWDVHSQPINGAGCSLHVVKYEEEESSSSTSSSSSSGQQFQCLQCWMLQFDSCGHLTKVLECPTPVIECANTYSLVGSAGGVFVQKVGSINTKMRYLEITFGTDDEFPSFALNDTKVIAFYSGDDFHFARPSRPDGWQVNVTTDTTAVLGRYRVTEIEIVKGLDKVVFTGNLDTDEMSIDPDKSNFSWCPSNISVFTWYGARIFDLLTEDYESGSIAITFSGWGGHACCTILNGTFDVPFDPASTPQYVVDNFAWGTIGAPIAFLKSGTPTVDPTDNIGFISVRADLGPFAAGVFGTMSHFGCSVGIDYSVAATISTTTGVDKYPYEPIDNLTYWTLGFTSCTGGTWDGIVETIPPP